jgi:hypothetical protein
LTLIDHYLAFFRGFVAVLFEDGSPLVALYFLKMEVFGRKLGGVWDKIGNNLFSIL